MASPATSARPEAAGSARSSLGVLWRRGQHGWPARFPVAQFPNAPLLVAMAALLLSRLADGEADAYASAAFHVGLSAWAWGEMSSGINWFRRVLGTAGLAYVILSLAGAFAERA